MHKKIVAIAGLLLMAIPAFSQSIWTSAGLKKSFGSHWGTEAEIEYRTHNKLSSTERVSVGFSAEYKYSFLKVDAGYTYILSHTEIESTKRGNLIPPYWINRHRIFASLTGKLDIGSFELSLRERYQFTHRVGKWVPKVGADGVTPKDDEWIASKDKHILRSRLEGEYKIRKSRFRPYASVELYDNLSDGFAVEKIRYTAGSEYRINRHNRVELYYRFVQGVAPGEGNLNVIGLGYSFRL